MCVQTHALYERFFFSSLSVSQTNMRIHQPHLMLVSSQPDMHLPPFDTSAAAYMGLGLRLIRCKHICDFVAVKVV